MGNSYFQFKQFMVHQDACGMKISTDAVILGAMAFHHSANRVLDVGTGTGVIALMMAQRFGSAHISGVEYDGDAFRQASGNVAACPWKNRIDLYHQSFQDFACQTSKQFDLIVSNPPYFEAHLKSLNNQRNVALHNDTLSFVDLIRGVVKLLDTQGKFWVILPERQMAEFEKLAELLGLFVGEIVEIRDKPGAPILRIIGCFSFHAGEKKWSRIFIREKEHLNSEEYKKILKDFFLAF